MKRLLRLTPFQNAANMARIVAALSFAAFSAGAAFGIDGSAVVTGGGTVEYKNADSVTWVGSDLLLKFTTNSTSALAPGSFTLPGVSQLRILAVGGGGGGGGAYRSGTSGLTGLYGGGGGGGAGGFVETNGFYSVGTYSVVVGAGGAGGMIGGSHGTSVNYNGARGGHTTITTNGVSMITAYGGGGGGGEAVGLGVTDVDKEFGSGGGGSMYRASAFAGTPCDGGKGTSGQGNSGGKGQVGTFGGGGGGAGGPGTDTGTDKATANPTGGIGKASDITGSEVWYAGGGGGGHSDKAVTGATEGIAGGLGGGGNGGVGTDLKPTTGGYCTGGGGGGTYANTSTAEGGAAGGSGVVYIRISIAIEGNLDPPESTVTKTYNGEAQKSIEESFAYDITGQYIGTNVDVYVATVTLKDGFEWSDPTAPKSITVTMTIKKAQATIAGLWMKGWMQGTPEEATPNPQYTLNFPEATNYVVYTYKSLDNDGNEDGAYDSHDKPTDAGKYRLYVTVNESQNLLGTVEHTDFSIIKGLGGQFTDYVELTIEPYTGSDPAVLTNFPYKVTVADRRPDEGEYPVGSLVGFSYDRAGKTGEDMAFTDADGNELPYVVPADGWNMSGESTVYVRVPRIDSTAKTIYLYWHLREGQTAPHTPGNVWEDWTPEAAAAAGAPGSSFDLVVRDGFKVEYWSVRPKMTKTMWDETDAVKGELNPTGTLADGAAFTATIINSHTGETLASLPQTEIGAYRIRFELDDPSEYEPFSYAIDFCITGDITVPDLRDGAPTLTLGGRVMLANDDYADPDNIGPMDVTDQSYWQERVVDGITNEVFWTHDGLHYADPDRFPNIRKFNEINHTLCQSTDGVATNVFWRFFDVLMGNTYRSEGDTSAIKNFLPCSQTQKPDSAKTNAVNIVMRNKIGAVVYSPCYTNGIGTIYFDAVNGWINNVGDYNIVVELATETIDGKPPTDENAYGDNGWGNNTWDGRLRDESWKPCQMTPLKRDGTPGFVLCDKTETLSLDISHGGTADNFYRVCVNVDERRPCRFRIRRVAPRDTTLGEDEEALLLLDNIEVSYPRPVVKAEPLGWYDYDKTGTATLGQELATTVPFPEIGDEGAFGRARIGGDVSTVTNAEASTFVLLSRMHYRWRYLNQAIGEWKQVDLPPATGFVASEALKLPADAGDIEFWFESFTSLPHCEYHDYSGLGLGLGGLYTESQTVVTNTWRDVDAVAASMAASGGDDWFFRMREGASDWEKASVVVNGFATDMELVGDNLWRGLVRVADIGALGDLPFYFELNNLQTAGSESFAVNAQQWFAQQSVTNLPGRGDASVSGSASAKVRVDEASGYIEFQLNDRNGVFSAGHAEYQSFNGWHDAHTNLFVGSSVLTSGVSSVEMMKTNANMRLWPLTTYEESNWNLPFTLSNYQNPDFPKGELFINHYMPGNTAWTGELGQFVDAELTDSAAASKTNKSGIAWQMCGKSLGKVMYDKPSGPLGLDTVTFKARLGQAIDFDDFAVCESDGTRNKSNYTFVFPAVMSIANGNDYAPGASMSLVGYYHPNRGCYEFRVTRSSNDGLELSIYKWTPSGGEMTSECIAKQWYANALFQHNNEVVNKDYIVGASPAKVPYLFGMFISLGEDNGATTIIAGLGASRNKVDTAFSGNGYRHICCIDNTDTKLTKGTYGVLSTNCKGIFLNPRIYPNRVPLVNTSANRVTTYQPAKAIQDVYKLFKYCTNPGNNGAYTSTITFQGSVEYIGDTMTAAKDEWDFTLGRAELDTYKLSNGTFYYGVRSPEGLKQTVGVYLKPRDGSEDWSKCDEFEVSSYGWADCSANVRTNANVSLQLRAGSKPADVAVWQITQTGWNGVDSSSATSRDSDFIYTQATIVEKVLDGIGDTKVTNHYAKLQPARAVATRPLSIRGPLVHGIGLVGFSYEDVDPACEVLVQVATNNVKDNLSGSGGYNESILEVPADEQEPFGYWVTMARYTGAELGASGSREFSFGWHDATDNPLVGVMRILVKPSVVDAAHAVVQTKPEYGSITVTGFWVHDEPPLDSKSWIGWNLRTIGDKEDSERRMFLPDTTGDAGPGTSAGLNNSMTADIAGDVTAYKTMNPTIQSPTFGGSTWIGQVRFRARLYTNEVASAKVFLYGSVDGAGSSWTEITNFTVTSSTYLGHSFSAIGERYRAVRLAVDGVVKESGENPNPQRVLIDEVVVSEKAEASLAFAYARPFRNYLADDIMVPDILDKSEQPLLDESWGVQAKLRVGDFDTDIDVERGFKVTFRYFVGRKPWGWANWVSEKGASKEVELKQVGDPAQYVFRSTVSRPETVVPAQSAKTAGETVVVQYLLMAKYYLKGSDVLQVEPIAFGAADGWWNPEWYEPVDLNAENGGVFSPYTMLEAIAPGRAWINEVNYNDGPKKQNGGVQCLTNQFIEVAVPAGVDMTGWKLVMNDMNCQTQVLAVIGKGGRPAEKTAYGRRSGDYDLYVLQSPASRDAGGIRDPLTGKVVADATWSDATLTSTFKAGSLQYDKPYQFELYRPSGVLEHQFVVGGTNEWRGTEWEDLAYMYDATNLMSTLDFLYPSAKRFYAGDDVARKSGGVVFSSLGVTGAAHGEEGGWSSDMVFTPGSVNAGQEELSNWYIRPNGGSCWVYATVLGQGLSQRIGSDTADYTFAVVSRGGSTNIDYNVAQWYQLDSLTVNGKTNSAAAGAKGSYVLHLSNVTSTTYVVATGGISSDLIDMHGGLKLDDAYTPAIMRWLSNGSSSGAFVNPDGPIQLAQYKGLNVIDPATNLSLKIMYWLDIDPTQGGWWLRGGVSDIKGDKVYRKRKWNTTGETSYYTNRQIRVKLYLSNDVTKAVYAPYRLQGLGGEQSDSYTGGWTSETFKVEVYLNNGLAHNQGFMPFRWFVFGPDSFEPKGSANGEYSSLVEILDPFSTTSPGYSYGWTDFGMYADSLFFQWNLDEKRQPASVETLKADSSYNHPPYEDWE